MKKRITFAGLLFFSSLLTALGQNITILPGIILPQMTTTQRTTIASPQNGMLVFDTDTQSYWFRQNSTWVNLSATSGGDSGYWQLNGAGGNEIQNTNTGGIWSAHVGAIPENADNTTNPPTAPVSGEGTRMMWIPSRSAFRVGTVIGGTGNVWDAGSIGLFSFATGFNTVGTGKNSTAMGYYSVAQGDYSTAIGYGATATGPYSTAMGNNTYSMGEATTTMGFTTSASGNYSTAMGNNTTANGKSSVAMGEFTIANGYAATTMGNNTQASGSSATAMGEFTIASGYASTAMGYNSTASVFSATAMGYNSLAGGTYSTAMGYSTEALGEYSTAIGYNTTASGQYSTAMGYTTTASGIASTAIGTNTTASGDNSTAMGRFVSTNGQSGSFIIGDTDPYNQGASYVGFPQQFVGRFANGYYLMTCGNTGNGNPSNNVRTGMMAGAGANAWSSISDSTKKEKHQTIDSEGLLQKISKFRLTTWNYKGQDSKTFRHYGPMAQDFYAAFGKDNYGSIGCDTLINQADFDGINFTAIQALVKRTDELTRINEELKSKNDDLEKRLARVENILINLKETVSTVSGGKDTVEKHASEALLSKKNKD